MSHALSIRVEALEAENDDLRDRVADLEAQMGSIRILLKLLYDERADDKTYTVSQADGALLEEDEDIP